MFEVSFGSERREAKIREIATTDRTTAVILAAVHFEWTLKRAILHLSQSPTAELREQLSYVYGFKKASENRNRYDEVWKREVVPHFRNSALGTVIGRLVDIQNKALNVRGKVVHGNGVPSNKEAEEAIELFLSASKKIRDFASKHQRNIDSRLKTRHKSRAAS